jgi:hypothetical protein
MPARCSRLDLFFIQITSTIKIRANIVIQVLGIVSPIPKERQKVVKSVVMNGLNFNISTPLMTSSSSSSSCAMGDNCYDMRLQNVKGCTNGWTLHGTSPQQKTTSVFFLLCSSLLFPFLSVSLRVCVAFGLLYHAVLSFSFFPNAPQLSSPTSYSLEFLTPFCCCKMQVCGHSGPNHARKKNSTSINSVTWQMTSRTTGHLARVPARVFGR